MVQFRSPQVLLSKKRFLFLDKLLIVVFFLALGVFRPDFVIMTALVITVIYLLWTRRPMLYKHLLIASVLAIVWQIVASSQYGYNQDLLKLFGANIFPLIAWALGLFAVYLIYSYWENILRENGYLKQMALFNAFYIPLLLASETIAYHLFNIQNIQSAQYPGLPLCDCVHLPLWGQAAYILMGTIYFSFCYLLRLENPHR